MTMHGAAALLTAKLFIHQTATTTSASAWSCRFPQFRGKVLPAPVSTGKRRTAMKWRIGLVGRQPFDTERLCGAEKKSGNIGEGGRYFSPCKFLIPRWLIAKRLILTPAHHHIRFWEYPFRYKSKVESRDTIGMLSTILCAISKRSKGSLCIHASLLL